jgi:F-type H+-transporting ATPase subunit epsilon
MAQAHKVHVRIVTAEAQLSDDEADMVIAPGGGGEIGIQARHIPIVTTLKPGELRVRKAADEDIYSVSGGFMEVRNEDEGSAIIVLANAAERADTIDLARAQAARERAEERLAGARGQGESRGSEHGSAIDTTRAEAALARALTRIRVVEQYKTRRSLSHS